MANELSRRQVLKAGLVAATAAAVPGCFRGSVPPPLPVSTARTTPWPEANEILAATVPPEFVPAIFPVTSFGARGDGRRGEPRLFSAPSLRAATPPVLTRYEGIECVNHSPMIYA